MTLNQVTAKLLQIAAAHKQVRTARHLQPEDYLVNDYKDADYVAVWFTLQSANYSGKERFLSYLVTVADMHSPEDMNELEMQSDCLEIAYDLIAQIGWDGFDWVLVKQGSFEFFREGQEDILAGVTFEIQLKLPYVYDTCQVPTDFILPNQTVIRILATEDGVPITTEDGEYIIIE